MCYHQNQSVVFNIDDLMSAILQYLEYNHDTDRIDGDLFDSHIKVQIAGMWQRFINVRSLSGGYFFMLLHSSGVETYRFLLERVKMLKNIPKLSFCSHKDTCETLNNIG